MGGILSILLGLLGRGDVLAKLGEWGLKGFLYLRGRHDARAALDAQLQSNRLEAELARQQDRMLVVRSTDAVARDELRAEWHRQHPNG